MLLERIAEVGFDWVNMGGRFGEAGGVCGLKRVANLSMSDSGSGLGSGIRGEIALSGVVIIILLFDL